MNSTNPRINIFAIRNLAWLAVLFAAVLPATAAPLVQTNDTAMAPRSVFIQPTSFREGRDPFFPGSTRPYVAAAASSAPTNAPTSDLSSLVMQGTFGTSDHRLAIINNVTFGEGDNADVITAHGRIRIHCLQITGNTAVIESGGQRLTLQYSAK
jgi:hypothetical protein